MASSKPLTDDELRAIVEDPEFYNSDVDSNADTDEFIPSDHDTSSAASLESDNSEDEAEDRPTKNDDERECMYSADKYYFGKKNCYMWSKESSKVTRTRAHNIVLLLPGTKNEAKNIDPSDILSSWQLFVTNEFLQIILMHTNNKIEISRLQYKSPQPTFTKSLDMIELRAFIGLLYLSGVMKSNHENILGLFAEDGTGRDIFRATMSARRFMFILSSLRFDCITTREARKSNDRLAAVREIWDLFISNVQKYYTPGVNLTIDEMLVPFRGKCRFRMYMPNKPAKYGLKILCLCDSRTFYLYNAFVYTGRDDTTDRTLSIPTQTVLKLITPIEGTNRNITCDNWFMSVELCNVLKAKSLTVVGTLKQNKPQIPPEFKKNRKRAVSSSIFGHNENITICSHVPKRNRAVVLLSTMHQDQKIDETTNKPDIIMDYNAHKAGVDALDQLCANYTVSRRTRRWPMAIFNTILNIVGINAMIILNCNKKVDYVDDIARRNI